MQRYIDELRLLHALRLAVLATDEVGAVTFANEAAADTCACSVDELLGKDIRELASDPQADDPLDLTAVLAGQTWSGDLTVRRPRGDTFVASISATPLLGDI